MKFAKELQEDLVPEWRAKYLNYKLGKKKVKAVSKALAKSQRTPQTPRSTIFRRRDPPAAHPSYLTQRSHSYNLNKQTPSERDLLRPDSEASQSETSYGSIVNSNANGSNARFAGGPPSLKLPGPALSPSSSGNVHNGGEHDVLRRPTSSSSERAGLSGTHGGASSNDLRAQTTPRQTIPQRSMSMQYGDAMRDGPSKEPSLMKRMFSDKFHQRRKHTRSVSELQASPYLEFKDREHEFLHWLDDQLEMVEGFYKLKEDEVTERLGLLKQQLHKMRDLRVREVQLARQRKLSKIDEPEGDEGILDDEVEQELRNNAAQSKRHRQDPAEDKRPWYAPIEHTLGVGRYRFGRNTEALERMMRDEREASNSANGKDVEAANGSRLPSDNERDYARRARKDDKVPYEKAKRLLKQALQEFYRGLDLLKNYTLLNRTAFRKINKKYDKAVHARPTLQFFNEKVNRAYFVQSTKVDQFIVEVEDLFTSYFAGGNRKVAISKLRGKIKRPDDLTDSMFRSGLFFGTGLGLALPALIYAGAIVTDNGVLESAETQANTAYLLQIYGGYFLMLFLFTLFCLDARVWTRNRVNYVFIFEFDTRHNLDWRQLFEIPSVLFFLLGLFLILNFHPWIREMQGDMFIYWPVLLNGLSLILIFIPLPILYHKSRLWFAESLFRLFFAGLFSVEFRDFFLGDMFCSLTYSMGNLEVFFCLYAHHWSNISQCNSSSSRLLGFFSTLPGIWRFLQCIRRYAETKNAFPHLLNCGKYLATIVFYMTLSLWRISRSDEAFYAFVTFATINALYTSLWDVFMDWSLGHPGSNHRYLRNELAYKKSWWYYGAILVDPPLRFNWIFYAIFRNDMQHSAILSFVVALSEVLRRAIWTIFRVENEHCTNVGRFRASRDVSLPYALAAEDSDGLSSRPPSDGTEADPETARTSSAQVPQSPLQRIGTAISLAHAQDFVRKRFPRKDEEEPEDGKHEADGADSDEDDEFDDARS